MQKEKKSCNLSCQLTWLKPPGQTDREISLGELWSCITPLSAPGVELLFAEWLISIIDETRFFFHETVTVFRSLSLYLVYKGTISSLFLVINRRYSAAKYDDDGEAFSMTFISFQDGSWLGEIYVNIPSPLMQILELKRVCYGDEQGDQETNLKVYSVSIRIDLRDEELSIWPCC